MNKNKFNQKIITSQNGIIKKQSEIINLQEGTIKRIFKGWDDTLWEWGKTIRVLFVLGLMMLVNGIQLGIFIMRLLT